jgi:hypothetical protein
MIHYSSTYLYKSVFYKFCYTDDQKLTFISSYNFYGEVYLPSHLQDVFMQHFPFYTCFRAHEPIWMHALVLGIVPPYPTDANDIYNDDEVYSPLSHYNYDSDQSLYNSHGLHMTWSLQLFSMSYFWHLYFDFCLPPPEGTFFSALFIVRGFSGFPHKIISTL